MRPYAFYNVALRLGVTPSQETGTSPPSCLLLENRLCMEENNLHDNMNILKVEIAQGN